MFESMGGGKFFARVITFNLGITCLISGLIAINVLKKLTKILAVVQKFQNKKKNFTWIQK